MSDSAKKKKLLERKNANLEKQEILKNMEHKIFNPPVIGKTPNDKYNKRLQSDLYTILELHMQMLLSEASAIETGLYVEKIKEKELT